MTKRKCGLIGNPLGHSYSPELHRLLGDYDYFLWELNENEVGSFLRSDRFDALNVTIPYKKTVLPYLDEISPEARRIGAVNTITRLPGGGLRGDNTDYSGFSFLLDRMGAKLSGKKVVILGSGGASMTARTVAADRGARKIVIVSRSGGDNYGNLDRHADAEVLINCTPVGMFPLCGVSPVDLNGFPKLEAVADLIYNPARTALILDAEERGIPCSSGLPMLAGQAKLASERFTGLPIPEEKLEEVIAILDRQKKNVALVGMPGCGKSTVGRALASLTGREFVDLDEEIEKSAGKPIPLIFAEEGENAFRERETACLAEIAKRSSLVIAAGGGTIIRRENRRLLRQNSTVLLLLRPLDELPTEGRPLSQQNSLAELWEKRKKYYFEVCDAAAEVSGSPGRTAEQIREALHL